MLTIKTFNVDNKDTRTTQGLMKVFWVFVRNKYFDN